MMLAAAVSDFNGVAAWATPLLLFGFGIYLAVQRKGEKSSKESRDKDLVILQKDFQQEIQKTQSDVEIKRQEVEAKIEKQRSESENKRQELEAEIEKERNESEKKSLALMNEIWTQIRRQNDINDGVKNLMKVFQNDQKENNKRWDEFKDYQNKWSDSVNDKVQNTMLQVGEMARKLDGYEEQVKKMVNKSLGNLEKAEQIYTKANEKE